MFANLVGYTGMLNMPAEISPSGLSPECMWATHCVAMNNE